MESVIPKSSYHCAAVCALRENDKREVSVFYWHCIAIYFFYVYITFGAEKLNKLIHLLFIEAYVSGRIYSGRIYGVGVGGEGMPTPTTEHQTTPRGMQGSLRNERTWIEKGRSAAGSCTRGVTQLHAPMHSTRGRAVLHVLGSEALRFA